MDMNKTGEPTRKGLLFDCERCGNPIEVAAALLFSNPNGDIVRKHHICSECYQVIVADFIQNKKNFDE